MDLEDLEAFIANIEESAPVEQSADNKRRCSECNCELEDVDDVLVCPNCNVQADILRLEETDVLPVNEQGFFARGQRASFKITTDVDYGWAWTTDESMVIILNHQVTALEKLKLVPEYFRDAVKNMWLKFWLENIAPYIRDEYNEDDFIPMKTRLGLKHRDIEVLVKLRHRVLIPKHRRHVQRRTNHYTMAATRFRASITQDPYYQQNNHKDKTLPHDSIKKEIMNDHASDHEVHKRRKVDDPTDPMLDKPSTCRLDVSVLTLDRTLAFIEAISRTLDLPTPLFSSDIIRLCNQRLIPFYDAHKKLPENFKLNYVDRLMFQKNRPPSPDQLTKTACLLLYKIYQDKLPFRAPTPDINIIYRKFIFDLNLPQGLMNYVQDPLDFTKFAQTREKEFRNSNRVNQLPQYDRWVFVFLICYMKKYFGLDDQSLQDQENEARERSKEKGGKMFVFKNWARQLSIRFRMVMKYDPYVLFNPVTNLGDLNPSWSACQYIDSIIQDRASIHIRDSAGYCDHDQTFRSQLSEFLDREIPRPFECQPPRSRRHEIDPPKDLRHPFRDSVMRTRRLWCSELEEELNLLDIIWEDFSSHEIFLDPVPVKWSVYDYGFPQLDQFSMNHEWPYAFKLLITVGCFICQCEPHDIIKQITIVEEFLYPQMRITRRLGVSASGAKTKI